jgi:hypothetical protein
MHHHRIPQSVLLPCEKRSSPGRSQDLRQSGDVPKGLILGGTFATPFVRKSFLGAHQKEPPEPPELPKSLGNAAFSAMKLIRTDVVRPKDFLRT